MTERNRPGWKEIQGMPDTHRLFELQIDLQNTEPIDSRTTVVIRRMYTEGGKSVIVRELGRETEYDEGGEIRTVFNIQEFDTNSALEQRLEELGLPEFPIYPVINAMVLRNQQSYTDESIVPHESIVPLG